ncbi:LYAM1 protein, partial [Atractosteus spatula]|nr:LYAM1 protein [Atractosteus spatula]
MNEDCAAMDSQGTWNDRPCSNTKYFICYQDETVDALTYILIRKQRSWPQAQRFCREKHTDLVSVRSQRENEKIKDTAKGNEVWIGLFRSDWKWSDQESFSFQNWDTGEPNNGGGIQSCGAVYLQDSKRGKWDDNVCTHRAPFICYDGELNTVLLKELRRFNSLTNTITILI